MGGGLLYTTLIDYQRLLAGAQNRPSSRVRHPLLVWHIGLWHTTESAPEGPRPNSISTGEVPQDAATQQDSASEVLGLEERFAVYVRRIAKRIKRLDQSASISLFEPCLTSYEKDPRANDHPGLVVMEFSWHFFKATIRFEQHTEYCTVSALLDLSGESGRDIYCSPKIPKRLCSIIDELKSLDRMRDIDTDARYDVRFRDNFKGVSKASFLTVWKEFYKKILFTSSPEIASLGSVFADFRGIVLSDEGDITGPPPQTRKNNINDSPPTFLGVQLPFWHRSKTMRRVVSMAPDPLVTYWKDRYDLLWPLMTAEMGDIDFLNYEYTASMMGNGRALYLTALGAQPVKRDPAEERIPLCYGLYSHQLGSWAIGRLIEQINQQGTLRLASLIDLPALQAASGCLRRAEDEVRSAFADLSRADSDQPGSQGRREGDTSEDRYSARKIGELKASLARTQKLLGEADNRVRGGVEQRIERSRYYISRFRQGVPTLQIKQFGDMQPYDVFVERRLGPTFGYIDMLWSRYERVRRDMRALYQRLLAEETKNVATAIRDRNTDAEALHQIADLALFAVIGPYYLLTIITHTAFADYPEGMPNGIWLVFWLTLLGLAFTRPSFQGGKFGRMWAGSFWRLIAVSLWLSAATLFVLMAVNRNFVIPLPWSQEAGLNHGPSNAGTNSAADQTIPRLPGLQQGSHGADKAKEVSGASLQNRLELQQRRARH
jgi:hypothetical protein